VPAGPLTSPPAGTRIYVRYEQAFGDYKFDY